MVDSFLRTVASGKAMPAKGSTYLRVSRRPCYGQMHLLPPKYRRGENAYRTRALLLKTQCAASTFESTPLKTIVQGRNLKLTEALHEFAEEKVAKALSRFSSAIREIDMNLSVAGGNRGKGSDKQKCEVTIYLYRLGVVRGEDVEENMYAAIEKVVDIVARKMRKVKEKAIIKGKWEGTAGPRGPTYYKELPGEVLSDGEEDIDLSAPIPAFPAEIVRTKLLSLKPMSSEEAVEQVEQVGHAFYIFRDKDDTIKILYKRKHKGYGLIIPQFADSANL